MAAHTHVSPGGKEIEAKIIALEEQALELWNNGNPDGFLELTDDNVVYFDPAFDRKLENKKALEEYYHTIRGKIRIDSYEMINPHVHLSSDTAVLTYDYEARREGKVFQMHCTEVYRQFPPGQWKIVHTHWSFVQSFH